MQSTGPKAQAAERLLKAAGVAIKTHALYPLPHPMTARAVEGLLTALRPHVEAHGPFIARVTKHAISVGGVSFRGGPHSNLALYLYTRKISSIKIMPTVSQEALAAFVSIVGMDRNGLEAAGGVKHLLRQAGVGNIQVTELALEHAEAPEPFDLNAVFELLSRGRLAPQDRERVIEILRAGPEQAGRLLEHAYAVTGGIEEGVSEEQQAQQIYQIIKSLDRLVLDEPFEDQPMLYAALAGAHVLLREPLRTLLTRSLLTRDDGDLAARLLGEHLPGEELAGLVEGSLSRGDAAQQVAAFLAGVCADRQKARAVLAILDTRLRRPDQSPTWLTDAVWPQLQQPVGRREPELPPGFEFDAEISVDRGDSGQRLKEARAIDEAEAIRQVVGTLVDVLRHEMDEKELVNVADALVGYLPWFVHRQEFGFLAGMLGRVKETASSGEGIRRKVAAGILKKVTEGGLLDDLLSALWESRETPMGDDVQSCLQVLADNLVSPLVRALGAEPRGVMRATLCDLLVRIGADKVDELGAFVGDARWYLARNVVNVLGRLRSPRAVPYLGRLLGHSDYRVRRETVMALASIGTEEAQALLASLLDDPDDRIRARTLQSLDTSQAWLAMPKLLALLERRDLFNRLFGLRRAALEILARLGARQSLPAIKRLARARIVFGQRGRELRRLAGVAAAIIEGQAPIKNLALLSAGEPGNLP